MGAPFVLAVVLYAQAAGRYARVQELEGRLRRLDRQAGLLEGHRGRMEEERRALEQDPIETEIQLRRRYRMTEPGEKILEGPAPGP